MKTVIPALLATGMMLSPAGLAAPGDPKDLDLAEEVKRAIEEFNSRKDTSAEPGKEVVVVLPPPTPAEVDEGEPAKAIPVEEPAPDAPGTEAKLVTGKPPSDQSPGESVDERTETADAVEQPEAAETEGLGIRVESIRDASGKAEPGPVKLTASFPPKVLSRTPDGWILGKTGQAPSFREQVTLRPGKTILLEITPHVLTPAADGVDTFGVVEPGFDVSEGYRQTNTVSAILGNSVARLDHEALLLGNAISDLHQLLASLPKPEAATEEPEKP